jgi:hypothetical protein
MERTDPSKRRNDGLRRRLLHVAAFQKGTVSSSKTPAGNANFERCSSRSASLVALGRRKKVARNFIACISPAVLAPFVALVSASGQCWLSQRFVPVPGRLSRPNVAGCTR